jgi:hypothetical protein
MSRPYLFDESSWPFRPARWWQFWRPRSGAVGGCILSLVLMALGYPLGAFIYWLWSL